MLHLKRVMLIALDTKLSHGYFIKLTQGSNGSLYLLHIVIFEGFLVTVESKFLVNFSLTQVTLIFFFYLKYFSPTEKLYSQVLSWSCFLYCKWQTIYKKKKVSRDLANCTGALHYSITNLWFNSIGNLCFWSLTFYKSNWRDSRHHVTSSHYHQ